MHIDMKLSSSFSDLQVKVREWSLLCLRNFVSFPSLFQTVLAGNCASLVANLVVGLKHNPCCEHHLC